MQINEINWITVGADLSCPSPIYRPSDRSLQPTRRDPIMHINEITWEAIEHYGGAQ
jgi:hypothetical protein